MFKPISKSTKLNYKIIKENKRMRINLASLELGKIQHVILVPVGSLEHLRHGNCEVHLDPRWEERQDVSIYLVLLSLGDLNEHGHHFVQLVESDDLVRGHSQLFPSLHTLTYYLVPIRVKQVEDAGEVVLQLAGAEEVEEDHHVGHRCNEDINLYGSQGDYKFQSGQILEGNWQVGFMKISASRFKMS